MAVSNKKKSTAKRTVKSSASKAAAARRAKAAQASHAAWTQQSAKLYQMPFAQADVGEATKQAAATMQSATENMMRMGSDAMQQWWNAAQSAGTPEAVASQAKAHVYDMFRNVPGFDPQAQEKLMHFGRESAEHFSRSASNCTRAMQEAFDLSRGNAETMVEVSNIAVALSKELGAEMINFVNKTFAQNVDLSKQVLACRTLNDMFDLNSRFMKTNLDGFFSESVKLSELLFQCATDVSEPINERISESTDRMGKALAA